MAQAISALILVVDDQIRDARLVQVLLEHEGHKVTIETSGKEAIRILRSDAEFDCTLLDLLMPDVNGEQVFRALKAYAPARLKRLAFFTGMGYLAETWLARTGVPVIEKGPESPELVIRVVAEFAKLTCSRGPREEGTPSYASERITEPRGVDGRGHTDHTAEQRAIMKKNPSHPDLPALYDDEMDVDTGTIELAVKKGVSPSFITELRIRYLHKGHKTLTNDVGEVKEAVAKVETVAVATKTELGTLKTEISTTIKTSSAILGIVVILAGAGAWLVEHFLLKK